MLMNTSGENQTGRVLHHRKRADDVVMKIEAFVIYANEGYGSSRFFDDDDGDGGVEGFIRGHISSGLINHLNNTSINYKRINIIENHKFEVHIISVFFLIRKITFCRRIMQCHIWESPCS